MTKKSKMMKQQQVVRVPFQALIRTTLTHQGSGFYLATTNMVPGDLDGRLQSISNTFQLYRFVELEYELFATQNNSTGQFAVTLGTLLDITDVSPTQLSQCVDLVKSVSLLSTHTVSVKTRLSRELLVGESSLKWWKTLAGGATDWEEKQGYLFLGAAEASAGTGFSPVGTFIVRGVVEFSDMCAAAQTPLLKSPQAIAPPGCACDCEGAVKSGNVARVCARPIRPSG